MRNEKLRACAYLPENSQYQENNQLDFSVKSGHSHLMQIRGRGTKRIRSQNDGIVGNEQDPRGLEAIKQLYFGKEQLISGKTHDDYWNRLGFTGEGIRIRKNGEYLPTNEAKYPVLEFFKRIKNCDRLYFDHIENFVTDIANNPNASFYIPGASRLILSGFLENNLNPRHIVWDDQRGQINAENMFRLGNMVVKSDKAKIKDGCEIVTFLRRLALENGKDAGLKDIDEKFIGLIRRSTPEELEKDLYWDQIYGEYTKCEPDQICLFNSSMLVALKPLFVHLTEKINNGEGCREFCSKLKVLDLIDFDDAFLKQNPDIFETLKNFIEAAGSKLRFTIRMNLFGVDIVRSPEKLKLLLTFEYAKKTNSADKIAKKIIDENIKISSSMAAALVFTVSSDLIEPLLKQIEGKWDDLFSSSRVPQRQKIAEITEALANFGVSAEEVKVFLKKRR